MYRDAYGQRWYVFYGHERESGESAFLFNIQGVDAADAIRHGQRFFEKRATPIMRELYSLDGAFVEPLARPHFDQQIERQCHHPRKTEH